MGDEDNVMTDKTEVEMEVDNANSNDKATPPTEDEEMSGMDEQQQEVEMDPEEVARQAEEARRLEEEAKKAKAAECKEEGNNKYRNKDYYGALKDYEEAIANDPMNAAYYNNRAAAEMMLNLSHKAVRSLQKCLELDGDNVKAWIRLGKTQVKLGLAQDALDSFNTALTKDPTNSAAFSEKREADLLFQRIKRARECLQQGDFNQALAFAQAGLRQAPDSRELSIIRLQGLVSTGDYDQAYSLSTKLMRENQNDAQLLYYRAKCLYFQENFSNAIRHLQQALQLDPDNKKAQLEIRKIKKLERLKEAGNTSIKSHKYREAIDSYTECLEVDPENKAYNSKLFANRALAYQKLGKNEEALQDIEQAIWLNPDYGKAYIRRAQCLRALGGKENLERALHSYNEAERVMGRSREINAQIRETKVELKKASRKDYYKILELENKENSTSAEIKKAYKKAALKWHPDRHASKSAEAQADAEKIFKDVGEAYEVLSDPEKKQKYDMGQTLEEIEQGAPSFHHHDPNEIFQMFFGGGMGGGMGGMHHGGGGFQF